MAEPTPASAQGVQEPLLPQDVEQPRVGSTDGDSDSDDDGDHENQTWSSNRPFGFTAMLVIAVGAFTALTAIVLMMFRGSLFSGPAPSCRKGMGFATVDDDNLFVYGGTGHHGMQVDDPWIFKLHEQRWTQAELGDAANKPPARWKGVCLAYNHSVLMMGGDTENATTGGYVNDLWVAKEEATNPSKNAAPLWRWKNTDSAVNGLPVGRRAHAGALMKVKGVNYLYVHGGRAKDKAVGCLGDVWRVNVDDGKFEWEEVWAGNEGHKQPASRKGHSVVVMEGMHKYPVLVLYGGRNDTNYFGDTWMFNPVKRSWKLLHDGHPSSPGKAVPCPRDHHSAATHLSQMVIFGGRYGEEHETSSPLGDMWSYDVHIGKWSPYTYIDTSLSSKPSPRFLHGMAQSADEITMYIFGGQLSTDETLEDPNDKELRANDVWKYDFGTRQWTNLFASTCTAMGE